MLATLSPSTALRPDPTESGPVGLALTYSTCILWPLPRSTRPKCVPSAMMCSTCRASHCIRERYIDEAGRRDHNLSDELAGWTYLSNVSANFRGAILGRARHLERQGRRQVAHTVFLWSLNRHVRWAGSRKAGNSPAACAATMASLKTSGEHVSDQRLTSSELR